VFKRRTTTTAEELLRELASVPEVALYGAGPNHALDVASARKYLSAWAKGEPPPDAFLQPQLEEHPHLSQLPFRMGEGCRLDRAQARSLKTYADRLNAALAKARQDVRQQHSPGGNAIDPAYADVYLAASLRASLLENEAHRQFWQSPDAVPALQQILEGTTTPVRLVLVECLDGIRDPKSAVALVRRALFDPELRVRTAAVSALARRTDSDYFAALLDGFRHPWAAAADHAAEALVALEARAALPALAELLDQPDPGVALEVQAGQPELRGVRELVRAQHAGNCLLCHAPSGSASDLLRRPIPGPGQSPLPGGGYRGPSSGILVRADVTYLRQDFSVMLPLKSEPARYDYVVRTRPPTAFEREAFARRPPGGAQRQAVLFALRELTGQDAGSAAADWRRLVASPGPAGQEPALPGTRPEAPSR
jgi:hypothetical protein